MRRLLWLWCVILWVCLAGGVDGQVRHELPFPAIPGYETLKCDFHMHTVFSDGSVWPPVRVDEAWRVGLDAIAVTDHIEYQPHEEDVPTRHNRSYELAVGRARQCGVLLARGAEITRDTPPGHFNAIFLENVDPLETDDLVDVIKRANDQGAFVFWNHPGWKGPELGRWTDVHTQLYEKGWLHGIEVANGETYYPEAHRWCLEKQLTMMGNSDIHGPD
ncbi:MAG TPA: histidinol-phosphatase, partial [Planctomycetaceae bacterium]|nr:histidinol-phosphatase [Planctomycetaceae bacterium]